MREDRRVKVFVSSDMEGTAGIVDCDETTVAMSDDDPARLYRTFGTAVLLTRGIAE